MYLQYLVQSVSKYVVITFCILVKNTIIEHSIDNIFSKVFSSFLLNDFILFHLKVFHALAFHKVYYVVIRAD